MGNTPIIVWRYFNRRLEQYYGVLATLGTLLKTGVSFVCAALIKENHDSIILVVYVLNTMHHPTHQPTPQQFVPVDVLSSK